MFVVMHILDAVIFMHTLHAAINQTLDNVPPHWPLAKKPSGHMRAL